MTMDTATAVDVIDVVLDELVTLYILPVKRYEDMSNEDREKLVKLLVTRYGPGDSDVPVLSILKRQLESG